MRIPIYQIDAFARRPFEGNPAAVCPLETWLADEQLQAIAAENNLSETAFLVGRLGEYEIRWFTPTTEVDLCGHATLASGHVVLNRLEARRDRVRFASRSGPLLVERDGERLRLDFPSRPPVRREGATAGLPEALGASPSEVWGSRDLLAVLDSEDEVRGLRPDMTRLAGLDTFAVIVSARGREADFVSRFFAPRQGIPEDPVTGSAHCTLTPFWAARLGRTTLRALQVSARGGEILCEDRGDRVLLSGYAAGYLEGVIDI
jgi:predicted PhzF superfamily epimerase YddE/YHI9